MFDKHKVLKNVVQHVHYWYKNQYRYLETTILKDFSPTIIYTEDVSTVIIGLGCVLTNSHIGDMCSVPISLSLWRIFLRDIYLLDCKLSEGKVQIYLAYHYIRYI